MFESRKQAHNHIKNKRKLLQLWQRSCKRITLCKCVWWIKRERRTKRQQQIDGIETARKKSKNHHRTSESALAAECDKGTDRNRGKYRVYQSMSRLFLRLVSLCHIEIVNNTKRTASNVLNEAIILFAGRTGFSKCLSLPLRYLCSVRRFLIEYFAEIVFLLFFFCHVLFWNLKIS